MDIDRILIKNRAKAFLKDNYLKALVVCIIVALIAGTGNTGGGNTNQNIQQNNQQEAIFDFEMDERVEGGVDRFSDSIVRTSKFGPLLAILGFGAGIFFIILNIFLLLIGPALQVGKARFFMNGIDDKAEVSDLLSTFKHNEFWNIFKVKFVEMIYIFLWTLLFIIPGIIKSYEYAMVDFILAEEPYLTSSEAIGKSREMMNGRKLDLFVLEISFFGWMLLAAIIPIPFTSILVEPYKYSCRTIFYNDLTGRRGNLLDDSGEII